MSCVCWLNQVLSQALRSVTMTASSLHSGEWHALRPFRALLRNINEIGFAFPLRENFLSIFLWKLYPNLEKYQWKIFNIPSQVLTASVFNNRFFWEKATISWGFYWKQIDAFIWAFVSFEADIKFFLSSPTKVSFSIDMNGFPWNNVAYVFWIFCCKI